LGSEIGQTAQPRKAKQHTRARRSVSLTWTALDHALSGSCGDHVVRLVIIRVIIR
jgi:hypothetical protein